MADEQVGQVPSLRWQWVACVVAFVLAVGGVAFLVVSVRRHGEARHDLTRAQHHLTGARARSSSEARALAEAQQHVKSVHDQLVALEQGTGNLPDLDQRDLDAVKAAIQAGLAGDRNGYNAVVDSRRSLDAQHDTTVEQLRQQANAVIAALDQVNGTSR